MPTVRKSYIYFFLFLSSRPQIYIWLEKQNKTKETRLFTTHQYNVYRILVKLEVFLLKSRRLTEIDESNLNSIFLTFSYLNRKKFFVKNRQNRNSRSLQARLARPLSVTGVSQRFNTCNRVRCSEINSNPASPNYNNQTDFFVETEFSSPYSPVSTRDSDISTKVV